MPLQFINENLLWTQHQVQQHSPSDPFWAQVGLNLAMLRGITSGYNQVSLSFRAFDLPHSLRSFNAREHNALSLQFYNSSGSPPMTFTRILIANWDSDVSGVMQHLYPHSRFTPPHPLLFPRISFHPLHSQTELVLPPR